MDVEKAREVLTDVLNRTGCLAVRKGVTEALHALDGDGAEEWRPYLMADATGQWVVGTPSGQIIVAGMDEATARRIARLPTLERAADELVALTIPDGTILPTKVFKAIDTLRAALNQEGQ